MKRIFRLTLSSLLIALIVFTTASAQTEKIPRKASQKLEFKSQYFQERLDEAMILPYDISQDVLFTSEGTNIDTVGAKVAAAMHMLGYMYYKTYDKQLHVELLNKFQIQNGFQVTAELTVEVLVEIDLQLAERERLFEGSAGMFSPMFDHMEYDIKTHLFPKDFMAWVIAGPIKKLPEHLQMKTYNEFLFCVSGQCLGSTANSLGERVPGNQLAAYINDYILSPDTYYDSSAKQFPNPLPGQVNVVIHEYAHALDAIDKPSSTPEYPILKSLRTIDFYNLSADYDFDKAIRNDDGIPCFSLKTGLEGFLTYYGYDDWPNVEGPCPEGETTASIPEDFADSFSFYVTAGKHFRAATEKNELLKTKYTWLKDNVFNGVEYDTDLASSNPLYSGCLDEPDMSPGPGYISCDDTYVWDGKFPVLNPEITLDLVIIKIIEFFKTQLL